MVIAHQHPKHRVIAHQETSAKHRIAIHPMFVDPQQMRIIKQEVLVVFT
ncbi:Uncharacterised protein [Chlamydia trachomatis]|nr:Uncharacterised protein [Chlamydia trachomatis]